MHALSPIQKSQALDFFHTLQQQLSQKLESCDGSAKTKFNSWQKAELTGGGKIGLIRGEVVEKAGVNVSEVSGPSFPSIDEANKGKPFWAAGVSTITHMMNPYAPIGHMNVRVICCGDKFWVGGGADLTPFKPFPEDTTDFHHALKGACDEFASTAYEKYSKWCDEYFYIPHRQSVRGVGGIFFDYLEGDFSKLFSFLQKVALAYADIFPQILERRKDTPYSPEEKDQQLYWRGRYAEFNLVYDRGTKFGLQSGGNIDAIFVSMPPVVKW